MLIECWGELLGTLWLIVLGNGVVAGVLLKNSKAFQAGWGAITTGWFIAVVIGIMVAQSAGSINADINPAVSFAKFCLHLYTGKQTLCYAGAQLLGAFLGAVIVWLFYLPHFNLTADPQLKLLVFSTQPAIRIYSYNFFCEMVATLVLILGIAAIFGRATLPAPVSGMGAYLVGILVWGIGLSLGGPTGYAINPARDLGPRIAHALLPMKNKGKSDWSYAFIPVLAPLVGGWLAAVLWHQLF